MNDREYRRSGNFDVLHDVKSLTRDERRTSGGLATEKQIELDTTKTTDSQLQNNSLDLTPDERRHLSDKQNNKVLTPPPTKSIFDSQSQIRSERRNTGSNVTLPSAVNLTRDERRTISNDRPYDVPTSSGYKRKVFVDYDVVICIPSFNRYKKVKRLISQFYTQPTKYRFKIILLNDGSDDKQYDNLVNEFPKIIYLKNEKPNGKVLHWFCYNQMWNYIKNIECYTVLQMDDDFIISSHFLNTILDLYFEKKEENNSILAISPHLWSFKKKSDFESWWGRKDFIDGIALIDIELIKSMNYEMKPVNATEIAKAGSSAQAWSQVAKQVKNDKGIIFRTSNSLVYHDGNDESKLHGEYRKNNNHGVYTQKYIEKL
jgi:hypothetical protein